MPSADGVWYRAGISGDHSGTVVMLLKQDGTNITGTACYTDTGHLIWKDVRVTGRNPRVGFGQGICHFDGAITSSDELGGTNICNNGTPPQDWFFHRVAQSAYDQCVNAGP
jgi:hypothetical protein